MNRLWMGFATVCTVAAMGCGPMEDGPSTQSATDCCLCLLSGQTDGSSNTPDPLSDTTLDSNCVSGSAPFGDENMQCSTDASNQVAGEGGSVGVATDSCIELCATECEGFVLEVSG